MYPLGATPKKTWQRSPSHHLLKSVGVHFGIDELLDRTGAWRVETTGAEEAYDIFMDGKVDMAVIWEPHVTDALSDTDVVKLLGSEDVEKLIVDILLVNRDFAEKDPEIVDLFLSNYFKTLSIYHEQPELLEKDIVAHTRLAKKQVQSMLQGIDWLNLFENARWFGVDTQNSYYQEELLSSIESTVHILVENRDFTDNPLPNQDPYTIMKASFLESIYLSGIFGSEKVTFEASLEREFSQLTEQKWDALHIVGSLRLRPVTFLGGTSDLDFDGQVQLDASIDTLKHYPNFRIVVKGHTGARGDPEANKILSLERANAVREYFVQQYNMDVNRIRAIGVGGAEPLERGNGESSRSYNDRLKRVVVYMVSP